MLPSIEEKLRNLCTEIKEMTTNVLIMVQICYVQRDYIYTPESPHSTAKKSTIH